MIKKEYFRLEESPSRPGKYTITPVFENFPKMSTSGSFNLLPARLMNLSYAQYLRFCRDILSGEIVGKGHIYPIAYLSKTQNTVAFVRLLNSRMHLVMWERENPDWREHQQYLEKREEEKQARKEALKNNVSDNGNS